MNLLSIKDQSILNEYDIKIQTNLDLNDATIVFGERRLNVKVLNGESWAVNENTLYFTAAKIAIILLKKELLQPVSITPLQTNINARGVTCLNNNAFFGHEEENPLKDTRVDYNEFAAKLSNLVETENNEEASSTIEEEEEEKIEEVPELVAVAAPAVNLSPVPPANVVEISSPKKVDLSAFERGDISIFPLNFKFPKSSPANDFSLSRLIKQMQEFNLRQQAKRDRFRFEELDHLKEERVDQVNKTKGAELEDLFPNDQSLTPYEAPSSNFYFMPPLPVKTAIYETLMKNIRKGGRHSALVSGLVAAYVAFEAYKPSPPRQKKQEQSHLALKQITPGYSLPKIYSFLQTFSPLYSSFQPKNSFLPKSLPSVLPIESFRPSSSKQENKEQVEQIREDIGNPFI